MQKRKSRLIALLLATILCVGMLPVSASAESRFPDAEGWSLPYIEELSGRGILKGYPDGTVRPDATLTHAEYATLLCGIAGIEPLHLTHSDHWAAKYAEALMRAGVFTEAEYDPGRAITRIEIIRWTIRAMGGAELSESYEDCDFPDAGNCTEEEQGYLALSKASGLICGYPDGTVRPEGTCTRGESFAVACRYEAAEEYVQEHTEKAPKPTPAPTAKPRPAATPAPQLSVSIDAPARAEAYTPVEITIHHQNMADMEYEIIGQRGEEQLDGAGYEGTLTEDGGAITFLSPGVYTLTVWATPLVGEVVTYVVPIEVTQPAIRLIGESRTEVYSEHWVTAEIRSDMTEISWSLTKGGESVIDRDCYVNSDQGFAVYHRPGTYTLTVSGQDGLGNPVFASMDIEAYWETLPEGEAISLWAEDSSTVGVTIGLIPTVRLDVTDLMWRVTRSGEDYDYSGKEGYVLSTDSYAQSSFCFSEPGEYVFTLSGKDGFGEAVSASQTVKVYPQGEALSLYAENSSYVGITIGVMPTVRGDITDLTWRVTRSGQEYAYADREGCMLSGAEDGSFYFTEPGDYAFTLSGKDCFGDPVSASTTVMVLPDGEPITLDGATTSVVGDTVSVTAQVREDMTDLRWEIARDGYVGDGCRAEMADAGGEITFLVEGNFTVTLSGKDGLGQEQSRTLSIRVLPPLPVINLTSQYDTPIMTGWDYNITVEKPEGLTELSWTVTKDGEPAESGYEGDLSPDSVCCYFTEKGRYVFTLSGQDEYGRTVSASVEIEVYEPLPEINIYAPGNGYVDTPLTVTAETDLSDYEVEWSVTINGDDAQGLYTGTLDKTGGSLTFTNTGDYKISVTVSDAYGQNRTAEQYVCVKPQPHIRMNPLSRETNQERLDFVEILHLGTSTTAYPTPSNTDGFTVSYELLAEDGESAGADCGTFTPRESSYTFSPRKVGLYTVRATAEDDYGTKFTFTTKIQVVPSKYAEITGLPLEADVNQQLNVAVTPHDLSGETVSWKLSRISEENAEPYLSYGLKNLWMLGNGWQEISLSEVTESTLGNEGGSITFLEPGIYCLRSSVTDEYEHTVERSAVIRVSQS